MIYKVFAKDVRWISYVLLLEEAAYIELPVNNKMSSFLCVTEHFILIVWNIDTQFLKQH